MLRAPPAEGGELVEEFPRLVRRAIPEGGVRPPSGRIAVYRGGQRQPALHRPRVSRTLCSFSSFMYTVLLHTRPVTVTAISSLCPAARKW